MFDSNRDSGLKCFEGKTPLYAAHTSNKVTPLASKWITHSAKKIAAALNEYLVWCHHALSGYPLNRGRFPGNLLPVNAVVAQRPGKCRRLMTSMIMRGVT